MAFRILRSFLLLALALSAGCDETALPRAPDGAVLPVRLTDDAEFAVFERELESRVEQNRTRRCPRPVLRGEPLPGPAAPAIAAVVEGTTDGGACLRALAEQAQSLHDAVFQTDPSDPEAAPTRLRPAPADSQELRALAATCAPALSAMREAVRHEDGCSPYLPGLRGQPSYIGVVRLGRLAAMEAWRSLEAGRSREALEQALDLLRFLQDFWRGGTSVLEAMVAYAGSRPLLLLVERLLARPEPLGEALLAQAERELGLLREAEPHPSEILQAEGLAMALYTVLPAAKGGAWTPPGGWGTGSTPADRQRFEAPPDDFHPNDTAVLCLEAGRRQTQSWLKACPPESRPAECRRALAERAQKAGSANEGWEMVGQLARVVVSPDKRAAVREQIIEILLGISDPGFPRYLLKLAETGFDLSALRAVAAWRRQAEVGGACPGVDALPAEALRLDPDTGRPLRLERIDDRLEVRPSEPFGLTEPVVTGRCPGTVAGGSR